MGTPSERAQGRAGGIVDITGSGSLVITAITLSLVFIGGLAAYASWAVGAYHHGASVAWLIAGAPLLYLAIFGVITALWFALAWIYRVPRPVDVQLGVGASVRLFCEEWITLLGSGLRMGFGWWFMREPSPAPADTPVLLIHGVLCNAGVWLGMRGALRRMGFSPLYTISVAPPLASIDAFGDQLAKKIDAIIAETGARGVSLVGHSMGGLVARAYLRRYGSARVIRLITIGTPHAGSVHAWTFPGTSLGQLRPGNAWLASLNNGPLPSIPVVSIWSWHDSMVAPQDSACLPGAQNIALKGIGHNALLRHTEVTALVADALAGRVPSTGSLATSECPA